MTNEIIFYGGLTIAGIAFIAGICYFIISKIQKLKMDVKMDEEYGKENRMKTSKNTKSRG